MEINILVSGATGKIGRSFVTHFAKQGSSQYRITCLVRGHPSPPLPQPVRLVQYNLPHSIPTNLSTTHNPVVVHLAALTHSCSPDDYYKVNTDGTRTMLELASALNAQHFLFLSSCAIDPTGGPYARSKLQAEELVKKSGIPYTTLRLSEVYGLNSAFGIDAVIAQVAHSAVVCIPGDGKDAVVPLHRDDAIAALTHYISTGPAKSTIAISGAKKYTLNELTAECCRIFNTNPLIVKIPDIFVTAISYISCMLRRPLSYPDQLQRLKSPKAMATKTTLSWLKPKGLEEGLHGKVTL